MLFMPKLRVESVTMQFTAVRALDNVTLEFEPGEVHAIVGENGAGKSTLMKILSGIQRPTAGTMTLDGRKLALAGVRDAQENGIGIIHQELNLVDELSVAENVFLGREVSKAGVLDRGQMNAKTALALKQVRADLDPAERVRDLSIARKQLVEIAKAVAFEAGILIMDEPTAVLSEPECEALFALIAELKAHGVTVIYVSHRLAEVVRIADRVTVLRDGALIATVQASEATPAKLADLMVGRELQDFYPTKTPQATPGAVFEIRTPSGSITLAQGEIVGLAGLVGAGRTELAEAAIGLRPRAGIQTLLDGKPFRLTSPAHAMRHGIAYVSEDRKRLGLHVTLSVLRNITLANLRAYGVVTNQGKELQTAETWRKSLDIRVPDLAEPVETLSGGNQQKVSVAKWLDTKPKILILDEPTRGVDVGAKREMYDLIVNLAQKGLACLVISSELNEIIGLCHRAIVMREDHIVGEVPAEEMTEEALIRLASGVRAA
jgi:ABC-type sugar transport system ATPase subunit